MTRYNIGPSLLGENGQPLDLRVYNQHVYTSRTDVLPASNGAMSIANGDLGEDNVPTLTIDSEHVMSEEAALARRDMMLTPSTIYADGVGSTSSVTEWFTLPGCSVRWYQPYDTTWTIMQWSVFINYNSWRGRFIDRTGDSIWNISPGISIQAVIDGEPIGSTYRRLAGNLFHPVSPGHPETGDGPGPGIDTWSTVPTGTGGNPKYVYPEPHSAMHWDISYGKALTKGYHEINLRASMDLSNSDAVKLQSVGSVAASGEVTSGDDTGRAKFKHAGFFHLVNKISLGIRNARILALL